MTGTAGSAPPASSREGYRVRLEVFEGPLDLLLHLIRSEEMDIYDIPIARITSQYLDYIDGLVVLDLDLASEFLLMAATLMDIKSRMLLPRPAAAEFLSEEDLVDPRQELVERLLEYRRYKEAALGLQEKAGLAGRRHARYGGARGPLPPASPGQGPPGEPGGEGEEPVSEPAPLGVGLSELVALLENVLRELEQSPQLVVGRERLTVADKMAELVPVIAGAGEDGLDFSRLLRRAGSRQAALTTFLALIELVRRGLVRFRQDRPFGPVQVWGLPGLAGESTIEGVVEA